MTVINIDNLQQIQVLPMDFAIQEGGRTVVALGRRMAVDHEYVSEARVSPKLAACGCMWLSQRLIYIEVYIDSI